MSALVFRITGDPSSFKAAMGEVGASLSSTASRVDTLSNKLGSLGGTLSLGITAPVAALAAATVRSATSLDSLTRGLEAVSGSAEAAQAQLVSLREVAKLPGLGFREAIQLSTQLQAAGFSAELSERSLKAFGNALATVGKGKAELGGVAIALSQIAAKGKISQEEVNQLAERIPQIRVAIKAAFGTADTEVLQKLGVSSQEFVTKIVAELEKLKQVTGGPQNAFENLSDTIDQASARVGAKLLPAVTRLIPVLESLATSAANMVDVFTRMPEPVQAVGLALAGIIVVSGPIISAYSGIARALTVARDAYLAMLAAQTASAGAGVISSAVSAASAAKGVADAAAQIRAAKVALDAAVGIGYAETLAAQAALKTAQEAYLVAVTAEKAAIATTAAAKTAGLSFGAIAGIAASAGLAVGAFVNFLNTSNSAIQEQKRVADEAAASLKRLNDRYRETQTSSAAAQGQQNDTFDTLVAALKSKPLPSVKSIFSNAGIQKSSADYQAEIAKLRTAEADLINLQRNGQDVGNDLAIVRKKLADATKELAAALGVTETATEKVRVKLASLDVAALFVRGQDAAQQQAQAINALAEIFKRYGVVTVASAERMIRQQDLLFRSYRQLSDAPDITKKFSIQPDSTKAIDILIASYRDLANQPDITKNVNIKLGDLPKFDFPNFPEFPTDKAAKALGVTTQAMREAQAREAQKQVELLREANKRNPNEVSGNDVIAAEQKVKEILEGADKRTEKLSRGLQQVSTIITDLSRSVSNSAIDLLFSKPVADTSRFEEQLVSLRAEQDKLTAAQKKGQNVTAALTENQRKMAAVNQQMADAVKRTSLSFRAMETLKNIAADVAKSITRLLIEGALKRLGASLLNIGLSSTKVFTGIASSIGGLFGSGAKAGGLIFSAAGGGAQAATTAASSGAKVAGSVGSIAGAGLSATIGAVAGVGSLISGIVGNFQMKGMNKTLDLLEKSSRYTEAYTLSLLEKTNEFLPKLADIHQRLIEFRQLGIKLEDGGSLAFAGGGGDTFNFDLRGANLSGMTEASAVQMLTTAVKKMKLQGLNGNR